MSWHGPKLENAGSYTSHCQGFNKVNSRLFNIYEIYNNILIISESQTDLHFPIIEGKVKQLSRLKPSKLSHELQTETEGIHTHSHNQVYCDQFFKKEWLVK